MAKRDNNLEFCGRFKLLVDSADIVDMTVLEHFLVVVVGENVHHTSSVPVVRYTTTVVDVSRRVDQHLYTLLRETISHSVIT